ncbi:hypothetical protein PRIPAC_91471 [Pristionchus pacificus]|uniref:Uncharacterized protein n=1 Tax=Pristionchus pacificus TaxID=54126 RepID=A0A2A6BW11_PRIPA|nr:hypothetical protein PRIPAC_91471 [Pristionchus pacificus]|eukprot:PDM70094.1 hypothetical protein PRIPAC_49306 [Pristionchus pacificus]
MYQRRIQLIEKVKQEKDEMKISTSPPLMTSRVTPLPLSQGQHQVHGYPIERAITTYIVLKGEGHESKLVGPTTTCLHPAVTTYLNIEPDFQNMDGK